MGDQYELDEKPAYTREKLYLGGDYYSAGAVLVRDNGGAWQLFYINSDYLGSITHIVNAAGSVVAEYSYDAWGRMRDPNTQVAYAVGTEPELFLGRGYTGHEHLPWFGLINMNPRLYDPVHGRFLAPDPYVQAPDMTQNFNRYTYGLNNPLAYVDENGEFFHFVLGALIGGVVNWAMNGFQFNAKGLGYFAVGAISGALGAGVGAGISSALAGGSFGAGFIGSKAALTIGSSFLTGAAIGGGAGAASGFTGGFGNALVNQQNIGQAFKSGLIGGGMGLASGALLGGLISGIDAAIDGRSFWDGSTFDDIILADQANPLVTQRGDANCVAACGESATEGRITQEQIRNKLLPGSDIDKVGIGDGDMVKYISQKDGGVAKNITAGNLSPEQAVSHLKTGTQVFTNLKGDQRHLVLLNRAVERSITKMNGRVVTKLLFYAMDPQAGQYRLLNSNFLRSSNFWLRFR